MARKKSGKTERVLTMEGWVRRNKPLMNQNTPPKKKAPKKKK